MQTETVVLSFADKTEISFNIQHNLDEFGIKLEAAVTNWAARRTNKDLNAADLCKYIMSKDPVHIFAKPADHLPQVSSPKSKMFQTRDNLGNILYKEVFKNGNYKLSLKLVKEARVRNLGNVDVSNNTFYMERKRSKHVFHKTNSYGFNVVGIEQPEVKYVCVTDEKGTYLLTQDLIKQHGKYLFFKQTGYEKQVFIPLNIIEQHETL